MRYKTKEELELLNAGREKEEKAFCEKIKIFFLNATPTQWDEIAAALMYYHDEYTVECFRDLEDTRGDSSRKWYAEMRAKGDPVY